MKEDTHEKTISCVAIIGCAAVIFYLSNQPATVSRELSGGVKSIVEGVFHLMKGASNEPVVISHNTLRKTAHYFIYFVLGFLLMNALMKIGLVLGLRIGLVLANPDLFSNFYHHSRLSLFFSTSIISSSVISFSSSPSRNLSKI